MNQQDKTLTNTIISNIKVEGKRFDSIDFFWTVSKQTKKMTFNDYINHCKRINLYAIVYSELRKNGLNPVKDKEKFDSIYKYTIRMLTWNTFAGCKREAAAMSFLSNKGYSEILRAREVDRNLDITYKIDIVATDNETGDYCAFQVKGMEALKYTDLEKEILVNRMKESEVDNIAFDKFFLIVVPDDAKNQSINRIELTLKNKKLKVDPNREPISAEQQIKF